MAYVYKITHKETGEFYVGSKYSKNATPENTLDYFGSPKGKTKRSIRYKYLLLNEKHLLIKDIIGVFDTKNEALSKEISLHNELYDNPLCLNGAKQTSKKFSFCGSGENHPFFGHKHSDETKHKMKLAKLGKKQRPYSEKARANMSAAQKGRKLSDEHRNNLRLARLGKTKSKNRRVVCPHCNKEGGVSGMKHYHFDRCKFKENSNAYDS
jgi:hypothetical protein